MRHFRWLSAGAVPCVYDLRRCGWKLDESQTALPSHKPAAFLAHIGSIGATDWVRLLGKDGNQHRECMVMLGVEQADERARLLQTGFGDVLDGAANLNEIDARAARVFDRAGSLPRLRQSGRLQLDLYHRDGMVNGRALGLHPREFALLWRLLDTPGVSVCREDLLRDVFRMSHDPETNRLAVHVFRLRAKLAIAGLDGLVQTAPGGGYLALDEGVCTIGLMDRGRAPGPAPGTGRPGARTGGLERQEQWHET